MNTEVLYIVYEIWNTIPIEITIVLHIGSNYDLRVIIKELAEKLEGKFNCLGKNTKKYITFLVPIQKKVKKRL